MKVLGLINARGGSVGIPRKNIRLLEGKPLIAWSIEAGLNSEKITDLVVSTDDIEIAEIATMYGAKVPFIRPSKLATNNSLQIDVIRHAVKFMENLGNCYDVIVILQPTTPLRLSTDIDSALAVLEKNNVDSVISVCDVGGKHPLTCYSYDNKGLLRSLVDCNERGVLRQNFDKVLWRNGAIYAMRRDVVILGNNLYGETTAGYLMPEERSFNIDNLFDWDLVEGYLMLKNIND